MIPCYELIDVLIGNTSIKARPTGWNREIYDGFGNDQFGRPVEAVSYETVCPHCSQLLSFAKDDIYESSDGTKDNIRCTLCKIGKPEIEKDQYEARYIDPIGSGLFGEEVDLERLKSIDLLLESS
jgi:hypothetical protein